MADGMAVRDVTYRRSTDGGLFKLRDAEAMD
jgi:hypothetical protein